jgi:urease accessory protein
MDALARIRLLQMASQAFPIGGFSHSNGLESAIERGLVKDESSVLNWVTDVLSYSFGSYEVHMFGAMTDAWNAGDEPQLRALNDEFLASRETAELRSATVQMGYSMRELVGALPDMPVALSAILRAMEEPTLPCVWSGTANAWSIEPLESMAAYLWSWVENQVLVAVKSVPVGQTSGQRILLKIGAQIAKRVSQSSDGKNYNLSNFTPGLAILAAQHENQYSRLFRS